MTDNSRRTGAAIEVHYRFLARLVPTIEKFQRHLSFPKIISVHSDDAIRTELVR